MADMRSSAGARSRHWGSCRSHVSVERRRVVVRPSRRRSGRHARPACETDAPSSARQGRPLPHVHGRAHCAGQSTMPVPADSMSTMSEPDTVAESPFGELSLHADDFQWALIHLAWRGMSTAPDGATRPDNDLLFGIVELLPKEFPRPSKEEPPKHSVRRGREGIVRVARMPAMASDAVTWFRTVGPTNSVFPPNALTSQGKEPPPLTVHADGWEPEWPGLATLKSDHSTAFPYIPSCHQCPRVAHRVVARGHDLLGDVGSAERADILAYLSNALMFSFAEFPELLGSLHLVVPNPVHRPPRIRYRPEDRSVVIELAPRASRALDGLEMLIRNENPSGTTSLEKVVLNAVSGGLVHHPFPCGMDHVAFEIVCPTRGLLHVQPATTWISSISIGMSLVVQRRRVQTRDASGSTQVDYDVPVSTTEDIQVGEKHPRDARSVLLGGILSRSIQSDARRVGQQVFMRNRKEAEQFLRGVIGASRKSVTIVDPYFGVADLFAFALATRERGLPVRVVAWSGHVASGSSGRRTAESLRDEARSLARRSGVGRIEVLIMGSSTSANIHDRFLFIDDEVWLLGSSLNSFGTAGTVGVRLPDPRPVVDLIEAEIRSMVSIDHWISTHPLTSSVSPAPSSFANRVRTQLRALREWWNA